MRPSTLVVFDGQSLNNLPAGTSCYPYRTMKTLGAAWSIAAVSGQSFTRLATTAADRLWPLGKQSERAILVLAGGFADIVDEGNTGQQAYDDLLAYATAARAAGFDRVVATTLTDTKVYTAAQRTRRTDLNTRIVRSTAFDAVVDLGALPALQWKNGSKYFAADGVHWSDAGATVAADAVRPAVSRLLAAA